MKILMKTGILYLIPSLLSEENPGVIPEDTLKIIHSLEHFVVENEKTARHFLKAVQYPKPLQELNLSVLDEHTKAADVSILLNPVWEGRNLGVISEAGCPAVADPGSDLVQIAHLKNIEIVPLTGPSSILLALMASGLNGQHFSFSGYLPKDRSARVKAIRELERIVISKNQTQIFIEAPYRNQHLLEDILNTCVSSTLLCLAAELTSPRQSVKTKAIAEWKKKIPDIQKKPVVFLLGK
ncbi:SAM-dependent methyltransferase [soil metagenome]